MEMLKVVPYKVDYKKVYVTKEGKDNNIYSVNKEEESYILTLNGSDGRYGYFNSIDELVEAGENCADSWDDPYHFFVEVENDDGTRKFVPYDEYKRDYIFEAIAPEEVKEDDIVVRKDNIGLEVIDKFFIAFPSECEFYVIRDEKE